MMKICPKCKSHHNKPGVFCSRTCANSRVRSEEFKQKVREKLKGRVGKPNTSKGKYLVERISNSCLTCGNDFFSIASQNKKYCSNNCWKQNSGGYRAGSGKAKTGYFKGIYCGSTYELCWVIYNLDHNIKFTRFDEFLEKDGLRYYPDFLLDDNKTIVEIKGYENQESVDKKSKLAEQFGYTVNVLRKNDLQYAFEYVSNTYSADYKTLYDDYKPKHEYVCCNCGNIFFRNFKLHTDVVFCSRSCAGKGHKGRKKSL